MELTTTVTGPDVALEGTTATIWLFVQLVIEVAGMPLKFIVLAPCKPPKLEPVIVTEVPIPPEEGEIPEIIGMVPDVTETLSKVADVKLDVFWLDAPRPT